MFMRHFGHGVGHLQYERQHEIDPDRDTSMGQTLEDVLDSSDASDLDTGDSDQDHHCNDKVVVDLDEEEEEDDGEIVNGEGDASDIIVSDSDSDAGGSDSDSYASY
jgi:hypothetical protein